jgi:hypothetical protein
MKLFGSLRGRRGPARSFFEAVLASVVVPLVDALGAGNVAPAEVGLGGD